MQSLVRAMEILEVLSKECRPYSLAEVADATKLPPSTVHRVLQTFTQGSYVIKDEYTHLYKLGPSLVALGMSASRQVDLRKAVLPELRALTRDTDEDSYMVIRNGFKGLIVDKVEGSSRLKVVEHFGYEQDLDVGGMRKSMLAFMPWDFIEQYTEYYGKIHGKKSIPKLLLSLEKIRQEGIGVTSGDYIKEGVGIGAPIFDGKGEVVASIGVIMPTTRASDETVVEMKNKIRNTAAQVSKNLGYIL